MKVCEALYVLCMLHLLQFGHVSCCLLLLQSEIEKLKRQIAEKEAAVKAAQAQMPAAKVETTAQTKYCCVVCAVTVRQHAYKDGSTVYHC